MPCEHVAWYLNTLNHMALISYEKLEKFASCTEEIDELKSICSIIYEVDKDHRTILS